MDQIIPIVNWIKRNVFWLVCFFVTLAVVVSWIIVTMGLDKEIASNQSKLDTKVSQTTSVKAVTAEAVPPEVKAHPNKTTVEGMKQEVSDAVDDMLVAWKSRFDSQAKVRVWPKTVLESTIFKDAFVPYDPPEKFPVEINGMKLKPLLRLYARRIPSAMNRICKIIQTHWKHEDSKALADLTGAERPDEEQEGGSREDGLASDLAADADLNKVVVHWNEENQDLWHKKLTSFAGRDDNKIDENLPSPLQIFMLQQDLWLLEAMFETIGKVNTYPVLGPDGKPLLDENGNPVIKKADANDLAVIKRIDHIAFGREAQAQLGVLTPPDKKLGVGQTATGTIQSPNGGDGAGGPPTSADLRRKNRRQPQGGTGEVGLAALAPDPHHSPFHGRYVNVNFEPISAETVRQVLSADSLPSDNLELVIARRIPVRVAFRMDERHIGRFIDACNESAFTFEIEQVRINCHIAMDGIELAGGGSNAAADDDDEGERDTPTSGLGSGSGGSTGLIGDGDEGDAAGGGGSESEAIANAEIRTNYEVDVEFYGIVKLYNPVRSREFLTGEKPAAKANASAAKNGSRAKIRP